MRICDVCKVDLKNKIYYKIDIKEQKAGNHPDIHLRPDLELCRACEKKIREWIKAEQKTSRGS